uniref:Condensin complex subunit 2 n=1 Tax=Globisporangium ultimum (strain ATCC 200006 / CBS 805.95 / DAOM BR144) TaxID=431595 RepID=K3X8Z5_GLOUD
MATHDEDAASPFDESFFDAEEPNDSGDNATYEPEEDNDDGDDRAEAPSTPVQHKRKRGAVNTPGTVNDEDEVARRRRRRQSLAFLQRRKSLTLSSNSSSNNKQKAAGGASAAGTSTHQNRQYISDMYSTIIKMSSENKINVKNSWSLHLIDHMEDILGSSRKGEEEGGDPDDTYNFQKASCTLDASIKIYSYRVDDTWNSSYKILENLSRTDDNSSKQIGEADNDDDDDPDEPKSARKAARKHTAAKTIEKNLNNINLKNYELEFEADPLFHKMSQSFDEGGAKGMLLANLGLYDGCKILLNSSDVSVSTRKPIAVEKDEEKDDGEEEKEPKVKKEVSDPNKRISLASFGTLACFTDEVQSYDVCPPLKRLYEQLDEYYGDEAPQLKVKTTSEYLIKTPVKPKRLSVNDGTPVRGRLDFDQDEDPSQPMEVIEEVDEEAAAADMDVDMEDADANNDFDYSGGGDDDEVDTGNDDTGADANVDPEAAEVDGDAAHVDGSQVLASQTETVGEPATQEEEEQLLDSTASAADFFRSKAQGNIQIKEEANAYTMMIENALLRSASSANDDLNGTDDYSYFDVKMLRNWAGPVHWKFPAVRRVQAKTAKTENKVNELDLIEASDGEDDEAGGAKVAKTKKKTESKSAMIDFFATEEPDLETALKPRRLAASLAISKVVLNRQTQKASELVFPVDTHVEIGLFFQHFMKPKLRFFKRQVGQAHDPNDFVSNALDATYRERDNEDDIIKYEDGHDPREERGEDSVGGYGDFDYEGGDDIDDDELYSTEGLISANRVVEKIDVYYERFAKRVDVKKLKHSIWDHLEKETKLLGDSGTATSAEAATKPAAETATSTEEVERLSDDFGARASMEDTTFEHVVQNVSDRVPPDVTVSFYFICMLHLANEKGLQLVGQDDLRDFKIRKEATEEE